MLAFEILLRFVADREGPFSGCYIDPPDHPNPKRDETGRRVVSTRWLSIRTGVRYQTLNEWRKTGNVTLDQADRIADGLGYYPGSIWADYETLALEGWEPDLLDLIDYPELAEAVAA